MKKKLSILAAVVASAMGAAEPVVHFPLNEGELDAVKDVVGKTANIRIHNKEQFSWVDGPSGKALSFNTPDGVKTYAGISFLPPSGFNPAAGFTFTATVKTPNKLHRNRQYEIFHYSRTHELGPGVRIYIAWGALNILAGNGKKRFAAASRQKSEIIIAPNTWYRIAASYDGKTAKVYLNGKLYGQSQGTMLPPSPKSAAFIGASRIKGAGYGFNGIITDVKIFSKALSDDEIAALKSDE